MDITVVKRDDTTEPFSIEKIIRVVQAAGLDAQQAEMLAQKIQEIVVGTGKSAVTSLQIRDLVIGELHHVDENAANFFTWYQKTKDASI